MGWCQPLDQSPPVPFPLEARHESLERSRRDQERPKFPEHDPVFSLPPDAKGQRRPWQSGSLSPEWTPLQGTCPSPRCHFRPYCSFLSSTGRHPVRPSIWSLSGCGLLYMPARLVASASALAPEGTHGPRSLLTGHRPSIYRLAYKRRRAQAGWN